MSRASNSVDEADIYGFVFSRYRGDSPFSVMTSKQTSRCLASPQAALYLANHLGGAFLDLGDLPYQLASAGADSFRKQQSERTERWAHRT